MSTTFVASSLAQLQLDDAHRATLTAICALRTVAGDAVEPLLGEAQRLHSALCTAADEINALRQQARLSSESAYRDPDLLRI